MLQQGHLPEPGPFAHGCDKLTFFADGRFSGDQEKAKRTRKPDLKPLIGQITVQEFDFIQWLLGHPGRYCLI
jgi:hypothetical protein